MPHYVIIGGGIIGSSIGLEIVKRKAGEVTVLEKEGSVGQHASGRNSGVIHSGINQKPGTLKAKMCVEGSRRLREYCFGHSVPMRVCGTLVLARGEPELTTLKQLLEMGSRCGVPDLSILSRKELISREPSAKGIAALFSPTGAVVDARALLLSIARDASDLGVQYRFNHKVFKIDDKCILTSQDRIEFDHVINCAGLYADTIAHLMNAGRRYRVIPFRGEYQEVKGCYLNTMIYQAPDLRFPFLSIHLTREADGRILAGPNAVLAFGRESYNREWRWREMAETLLSPQFLNLLANGDFLQMAMRNARTSFSKRAFLREIQTLVSDIKTQEQLIPFRSGIRAQMVDDKGRFVDDILVEYQPNATHVLNAVSPGMTCSLAFAGYAVDRILGQVSVQSDRPSKQSLPQELSLH